jgi:hypothetical protein
MPGDTFWHRPHVLSFGPQTNGSPFRTPIRYSGEESINQSHLI